MFNYLIHSHFSSFSADPFSKKDWYDIKTPANFQKRNIGKTLVTRTTGTSMNYLYILFSCFCYKINNIHY